MNNRILLLAATSFLSLTTVAQTRKQTHTLIVFFDGLRPDYITPDLMPIVYAFSKRGVYGKQHHSVFPTVTRVNASSYSSGSYPATHGLMGNTVYFPQVESKKGLNTGEAGDLNRISDATHGHLLTAITLGEVLQSKGAHMMVFSSGSTGQALMQNHTVSGGAVINPAMILPASFQQTVVNDIGPVPPHAKPNKAQHVWVTDALMKYGLQAEGPMVSAIWYSDPDGTAHSDGIGSATAMESIRFVDHEFGRIIDSLERRGLTNSFNIVISADHGFVTHAGKEGLSDFLIAQGLKKDKESEDVVVTEGAVYVKDHDAVAIKKIIAALQARNWVGGIFTKAAKPGDTKGWVDGTLSFESIHWNHPDRAADILVDVNWSNERNKAGYEGTSYSRGVAGHGSMSPWEIHIALLAAGPDFKKAYEGNLPTSNVDIVPTILHIHHLSIPASMEGRVMYELLAEKNAMAPLSVKKETIRTSAKYAEGTYELILERSILGKYKYVDYSQVKRVSSVAGK
jgi:predicted AlkP superfamily pyrophosphatase or phosphodiesterase